MARVFYDSNKAWIRQGDVLLRPLTETPAYKHRKRIQDGIIARGEVTGHAHRLETLTEAELYDVGEGKQLLITGDGGVSIVHEEHGKVHAEPNTAYEIVIDREFDYSTRQAQAVFD